MNSRCPHCASIFDIPLEAFAAADGVVRCGGCMQLFDANQNRYDAEDDVEQESSTSESDDTVTETDNTETDSSETGNTNEEYVEHPEKNEEELDEARVAEEYQADKVSLQDDVLNDLTDDFSVDVSNDDLSENPVEELREEVEQPLEKEALDRNNSMEQKATDAVKEDSFELPQDLHDFEVDLEKDQFDTNFNDNFKWQPPVENRDISSSHLLRNIGFSLVGSVLVFVLALQWLLAYNNTPNSKSTWLSNAKQQACTIIPCNILSKNNPALNYQSLDLLVQSHPTESDALILKTTLLNSSNKTLPYPRLAIEFSSMNNQITAARIFSPSDYLNSSLLATVDNGLAVNQPIDIELELVDPGEDAVNYSLHFLNPES